MKTVKQLDIIKTQETKRIGFGQVIIYLLGIILVSTGIVLCRKCGLGISPVSMIPYILEDAVPLTFGNLTALFHIINIILQMLLMKKFLDIRLWLQVPLAFMFGCTIDFIASMVSFDNNVLAYQIIALILSISLTALGMVCMISMNLVQNPPDGFVMQLSIKLEQDLGTVKMRFDIACVVISVLLGALLMQKVRGIGMATVISAVFVGKSITWLKQLMR